MFADVDLRRLSDLSASERAFLSVYLAGPRSVAGLEKRLAAVRRVLDGGPAEKDEREHFDANAAAVRDHLARHPLRSGSLALFSCWALDVFEAVPLAAPVPDRVWVDSSAYIRPLAELRDEYENVAVVVADNRTARIYCVSSAVAGDGEVVKGNVKNHVKKGGWSQQRYERRRDKQLLLYAREIVDALGRLDVEEHFRRVVLAGGKEILRIVNDNLPARMKGMAATQAMDLQRGPDRVEADLADLFAEQERASERDLWGRIRAEYLRGGLGVVGLADVLAGARDGRVEAVVVERAFHPEGRRCRDCEHLAPEPVDACPACASTSLFAVDVVNEIVERLEQTGAAADFVDPIPTLTQAGRIAALMRY